MASTPTQDPATQSTTIVAFKMASHSILLDLPPELIVRIASYLLTPELGTFRRSCKQIEQYLFNSFAKEFFTKRQFMIEQVSLEALVGIANHPGLASSLQEVIIGTHAFALGRHATEYQQHCILNGYLTRNSLLNTGQAFRMLVDAFSKLPNLRKVGLRDYAGFGRIRDGEYAKWSSWGWTAIPNASITMCSPENIFPLMLSALAASKSHPVSIEVFLRQQKLTAESFLMSEELKLPEVLENLQTLMLSISKSSPIEYRTLSVEEMVIHQAPMRSFLSHLTNIEHLRMNFVTHQDMAQPTLEWLAGRTPAPSDQIQPSLLVPSPTFRALKRLDLGFACVEAKTLVDVSSHFNLQSLNLWKLTLIGPASRRGTDDSSWSEFLINLAKRINASSQLREVMIGCVKEESYSLNNVIGGHLSISWVPRGTQPDAKSAAVHDKAIEYRARYASESVRDWLLESSKIVYLHRPTDLTMDGDNQDSDQTDNPEDDNDDDDDEDDHDDHDDEDDDEDEGDDV